MVIANIKIDKKEPRVVETMTAAKLKGVIEAYKKTNPVKYELKKDEFDEKLEWLESKKSSGMNFEQFKKAKIEAQKVKAAEEAVKAAKEAVKAAKEANLAKQK